MSGEAITGTTVELGAAPAGVVDTRATFDWDGKDGTWVEFLCAHTMVGPDTNDLAVEHRDTDSDSWVAIPGTVEVSFSVADGNGVYTVYIERRAAKRQVSVHLHNGVGAPPWSIVIRSGGDEDDNGVSGFDQVVTTKSVDGLS